MDRRCCYVLIASSFFAFNFAHAQAWKIRTDFAEKELVQVCRSAVKDTALELDSLAAKPPSKKDSKKTPKEESVASKKSSLLRFDSILAELSDKTSSLAFLSSVVPDDRVRKEAEECKSVLEQFWIETFARRDLYNTLKKSTAKSADEKRLKKEMLVAFEKQGLKSPEKTVKQVKLQMAKLSDLSIKFQSNLDNDKTTLIFTEADLEGTSDNFRGRLKKDDAGNFIVTLKYPDYFSVMQSAKKGNTRRKMAETFNSKQGEANTQLLEQAIGVRREIARLLGFANWADYNIQGRMAKNSKEVLSFLNGLKTRLAKANKQDIDRLRALKKEQEPDEKDFHPWDLLYYETQLKKKDYALDSERLREYFPVDHVVDAVFSLYSKLFGVEFHAIPTQAWHPSVKLYEIRNAGQEKAIAYFYTDLYPREGKNGHAFAITLKPGRTKDDGSYSPPLAALVSNLQPPSGDKPALLSHEDVKTFFHEFGHIMHKTLTRAPYASLAGTGVYMDFVEAPSQMLENWVWDEAALKVLTRHFERKDESMPDELMKQLIATRHLNKGYAYTRQLVLALFDMKLHTTQGPINSKGLYDGLYKELTGLQPIKEGRFAAGFGHLMGGYDAGYYGYLWSEVYAQDMFSRFQKEGLLNAKVGGDYRKWVLEKGGMKDPQELLRGFLGRKPNNQAFLRFLDQKK